ncbi:type I-E CRISPR-associated protein Cse1/CasA [Corynebacterium liangguodongii]|uniref:Type I-E CRISPR-associated protein Cse1/CasA n=1 Tax=Corynebacterium liangguodongii TaxID=2079535 RepID=A0A2S0WG55_9CORY|nr:type I-E CRISPR-associated protein Cse1/CasA [Corynebacterium liangguodongii]AWB84757.1 type I-E CRISPR-associated protein Cse1/CasA [Corynebacterium liangguodongii]PWB99114.1 type I-E CRISPR-associated protein Cse1/CasA [Corynebacterium liangguodongii]
MVQAPPFKRREQAHGKKKSRKRKEDQSLEEAQFNLVDDPWIIVHDTVGTPHTVGIRSLFDGSVQAVSIVGDSPTQDYALLRVLLAIFWRAHHDALAPQLATRKGRDDFEWNEWFAQTRQRLAKDGRDDAVLEYLEKYRDRFELFDPVAPFMQVADLHTESGETSPISRIVPELAQDHFALRAGEARESLTFAEAARWLIHTQAYDHAGNKTGAVGDPRVIRGNVNSKGPGWTGQTGGTVVLRPTLLETLLFNTTKEAVFAGNDDDHPVWEREPDTSAGREEAVPKGSADLATWQARRVRLFPNDGRVTACLLTTGERIVGAGKNVFGDPMTPYRFSKNKSTENNSAYFAQQYDRSRTMWRSLDPLIATQSDPGFDDKTRAPIRPKTLENLGDLAREGTIERDVLNLRIVSMGYGSNASVVETVVSASINLPVVFFEDDELAKEARSTARSAATATTDAAESIGWFAGQLYVAAGGEYVFGSDAADRFLARLEPQFNQWLAAMNWENLDESAERWQQVVLAEAKLQADELVAGAGPKALAGRVVPPRNEGDKPIVLSAGGLRDALARRLRKNLPLVHPKKTSTHKESAS